MRPRRRVVYHWQVMADSKPAVLQGAAATSFVAAVERVKPHTKLIGLLAFGHLVIDLNQGAIPAVLPVLLNAHGLAYAEAATSVLVGTLTSSLIQPVFGYRSDQIARRWILPASVFLAGAGLALTGIAPGYLAVLGLVLGMGLGVAAWHPEGYKAATGMAGDRKATALSWFSLGGNVGMALGPPVITSLVTGFSLAGTLGMLVPTVIVGGLLLAVLPHIDRAAVPRAAAPASARGVNMPRAMALLIFLVAIRSWAQLGFTTFVPFYYVDYLKADPRLVGPLLFVFLGVAALGSVADHWGLPAALAVSALMPLAGFVTARFLPAPRDAT